LSPGILAGIVKTLKDVYWADVAAHCYEVNSCQMAYQKIREYYAVCLPVTLRVEDRGLSRASERRRQSQLR
jgi:hypothetical protein